MVYIFDRTDKYDEIFIVLLVTAVMLRLAVINSGIISLLDNFLVDDAFYYYSIARNVEMGRGIVFSTGNPTNGFHPLYLIILVPLFDILYQYGINAPVYASLIILSIFTVGTSVFIYRICKKLVDGFAGVIGAMIWLFNPYIFSVSLAGTETPIQIFFISVLTWYLISINYNKITHKQSLHIGILLSLIFLSRMDGILMMASVLASLWIHWIGYEPSAMINNIVTRKKDKIYKLVTIGLVPSITIFLWMGWSYVHVKRFTPVSGAALRLLRLNINPSRQHWILSAIKGTIDSTQEIILFIEFDGFVVLLCLLFTLVPLIIITLVTSSEDMAENIKSIDFLIATFALFLIFYWFIQISMRSWYTLFIAFVLTVLISISLGNIVNTVSVKQANVIKITVTVLLVSSFIIGGIAQYDTSPEEPHRYQDALYISENIQPGAKIGSFNSGIRQYYTPSHTVVNLDGVVNPEAYTARSEGKLLEYISTSDICYLVVEPWAYDMNVSQTNYERIHQTNNTIYYNTCI